MANSKKENLRREARAHRAAFKAAVPEAGKRIAQNFLAEIPLQENSVIAGYIAARDELDPAELIAALRAGGQRLALPRVAAKRGPLEFHLWEDGAPVKGAYELFEAAPSWPVIRPNVLLVPLLAFDDDGYRLGYGGGYYDRSLQLLRENGRVVAVGLAYDAQWVARLPRDETDQKLDWVVTEMAARKFV